MFSMQNMRSAQPVLAGVGDKGLIQKRKGNENMLLDALIIPDFYFISTKC